jgi:hypothetical protein
VKNGCASEFGDDLWLNAETVFLDLNGLHHESFERFIARFHIGVSSAVNGQRYSPHFTDK